MKCKLCGHKAMSLAAMNAHYRKAHPNRPRKARRRAATVEGAVMLEGVAKATYRFCPHCGGKL